MLCALILYVNGGTYCLTSTLFWQIFSWQISLLPELLPKIRWEEIAEEISFFSWCLTWDTNPGFTYNKTTYYLLDYGDFSITAIARSILESIWFPFKDGWFSGRIDCDNAVELNAGLRKCNLILMEKFKLISYYENKLSKLNDTIFVHAITFIPEGNAFSLIQYLLFLCCWELIQYFFFLFVFNNTEFSFEFSLNICWFLLK